jgi:hypothetical protein
MASIFISYRQGPSDDAWARLLSEAVEEHFDVFLDTESIDYGEEISDEVKDALASCRVLLVVIGPDWTSEESLRGLHEKGDWVKMEIETALQRKSVKVLPILVGNIKLPEEEALPEPLKPVVRKKAYSLTHDRWEDDCRKLCGILKDWLSGQAIQVSSRQSFPPILPYLCNRIEQEEDLVKQLTQSAAKAETTFLFFLHGHKTESHNGFIDRLKYLGLLDQIFRAPDEGVSVRHLEWNEERVKAGQYLEALKSAIKRGIIGSPLATDKDLEGYFRTITQPILLVMQVTWVDYESCGRSLLFSGMAQAWKALFAAEESGSAELLRPPYPVTLWINVSYENNQQVLPAGVFPGSLLPELKPLSERHILEWTEKPKVKSRVAERKAQILALADDPTNCCSPRQIHMQTFAETVQKLFSG